MVPILRCEARPAWSTERKEPDLAYRAIALGDRVELWWDGEQRFYAGVVTRVGGGTCDIRYDDGDVSEGEPVASARYVPPSPSLRARVASEAASVFAVLCF